MVCSKSAQLQDEAFVVLPRSDPCSYLLKLLHHRIKYK